MKKLMKALTLSALLFSGSAYAEVSQEQKEAEEKGLYYWANKPVTCSSAEKVIELMESTGENPTIWMEGLVGFPNGSLQQSRFVIAVNPNANPTTWTIIEFTDGGTQGCVLGHGQGNINITMMQEQGLKT